jgi:C1A family cysteine protease
MAKRNNKPPRKGGSSGGGRRGAYGWVPDVPDHRDLAYSAPMHAMTALPPSVDLRPQCPKTVYDQGQLGSCTGNAIAGAHEFDQMKQGFPSPFTPSRLFIYYNERVMEGTVNSDAGAQIRDGIKSIGHLGVCPETMWPYNISKFTVKPGATCFTEALKHCAVRYYRVPRTLTQMKGCLSEGFPFVFGFSVYESFESPAVAKTGIVPMPGTNETLLGGHAVLAVGYNDAQHRFIVRNSWGPAWGMKGYFTMPYAYLLDPNLSDDFWTVRQVN